MDADFAGLSENVNNFSMDGIFASGVNNSLFLIRRSWLSWMQIIPKPSIPILPIS
jgi:hypothetical protein